MATMDPVNLLKKYTDDGYNILTPSITLEGLSERHKATVETVSLAHDPDYGDVYKHDEKTFIIAKQGLDKLSVLANILWHEHGGTERIDDGKNDDYIACRAFAAIRKADGSLAPVQASYDLDFKAIEEDLRYSYREKASKGNYKKTGQALEEYVEFCVGRDMRSKRKHRLTLCESGARNRVNRWLLGIKKKYTISELRKPFVVIRITYQPDYDDPAVKKLITMMSLGAQSSVFGLLTPPAPAALPDTPRSNVITIAPDDPSQPVETNGVDTEPDEDPAEDEPLDLSEQEFGLWDRKSQEVYIEKLATRKGYDLAGLFGFGDGPS